MMKTVGAISCLCLHSRHIPWQTSENVEPKNFLFSSDDWRFVNIRIQHSALNRKQITVNHDCWHLLSCMLSPLFAAIACFDNTLYKTPTTACLCGYVRRKSLASPPANKSDCRRRNRLQLVDSFSAFGGELFNIVVQTERCMQLEARAIIVFNIGRNIGSPHYECRSELFRLRRQRTLRKSSFS